MRTEAHYANKQFLTMKHSGFNQEILVNIEINVCSSALFNTTQLQVITYSWCCHNLSPAAVTEWHLNEQCVHSVYTASNRAAINLKF